MNPRLYAHLAAALLVLSFAALVSRFVLLGGAGIPAGLTSLLSLSGLVLLLFSMFSRHLKDTIGAQVGDLFVALAYVSLFAASVESAWEWVALVAWVIIAAVNAWILSWKWEEVPEDVLLQREVLEYKLR